MKKPLVIFLMGKAQAGKDTIAEIIAEKIEYGYKDNYFDVITMAFADTLKNLCSRNHGYQNKEKDRNILLEIGDQMRSVEPNAFILPVSHFMEIYKKMGFQVFIITDMRFSREYEALTEIQDMFSVVIRIQSVYEHKNISAFAKNHPSENLQFLPDYNIVLPLLTNETISGVEKIVEEIVAKVMDRYLMEIS